MVDKGTLEIRGARYVRNADTGHKRFPATPMYRKLPAPKGSVFENLMLTRIPGDGWPGRNWTSCGER